MNLNHYRFFKGPTLLCNIGPLTQKNKTIFIMDKRFQDSNSFNSGERISGPQNRQPVGTTNGNGNATNTKSAERIEQLSPGNPFIPHMRIADYNSDRFRTLYTSAIEWEANRQALLDQRAYNSPQNQANLMREAGLNPDLLGVGSSSGAGSSSAIPASDLTDIPSTLDEKNAETNRINAITGVVNSVASVADVFIGGFSSITNTIQSIKNFGNLFSISSSQSRLLNTQADIAEQTAPRDIALAERDIVQSRLQLAKDFASIFPYKTSKDGTAVLPTLEEITSFLSDYGVTDSSSLSKLVHNHMSNPAVSTMLDKIVDEQARQSAHNINRGFDFYNEIESLKKSTDYWNTQTDNYISEMRNAFSLILSDSDYVDNMAESTIIDSESSIVKSQDTYQRLQFNYNQFKQQLNFLDDTINSLSERNSKLMAQSDVKSIAVQEELALNNLKMSYLKSLNIEYVNQALPLFLESQRRFMGTLAATGVELGPQKGFTATQTEDFNYLKFISDGTYINPLSLDAIIQPIMTGVATYLGTKRGSKGSSTGYSVNVPRQFIPEWHQ